MTDQLFYLKFSGQRFNLHTLPISVLAEFETFQRLVELRAAATWKANNPNKRRLPKGFARAFELGIADIKDGSAAAELVPLRKHGLFSEQELEDAIKATSAILRVGLKPEAATDADDQFRRIVRKFGATLQEGDVISLSKGTPHETPFFEFDIASRRRLIRMFSSETERTLSSVGKLVGVKIADDWSNGRLEIASVPFGNFGIGVDPDVAKSEFDGALHTYIKFSVVAEMALDRTVRRVVEVDELEHLEITPRDVTRDLEKLIGFKDPSIGVPIAANNLAICEKFLQRHLDIAARTTVFPGSEGNLLLEFELNEWDVTLEILDSGVVEFYGYHLGGDNDQAAEFFDTFRSLDEEVYNALVGKERETW